MEVFNGIRYAKTGRWERPVLEPRLVAIADIETQVQICPQPPCMLDSVIGNTDNGEQQGEDCLRLSVFTPSTQGKRPVLVWFHGGAFLTGSGLMPKYDASDLAVMGDLVVVNISYRLSPRNALQKKY